jgi:hypothetical protein
MTIFLLEAALPAQTRLLQPADVNARKTAAAVLAFGLETWRDLAPIAGAERLGGCLASAILCLPPGSAASVRAISLRSSCRGDDALALEMAALLDDLRFQLVVEAELPRGVPGFRTSARPGARAMWKSSTSRPSRCCPSARAGTIARPASPNCASDSTRGCACTPSGSSPARSAR